MLTLQAARLRHAAALKLAPPVVVPFDLERYRRHVLDVMAEHQITADWREPHLMPRGAAAFARIRERQIVGPWPVDEETIAVALHEIGHILAEGCQGGDHYRDPAVRDWWHCLRCESLAWANAIALLRPLPWTRSMHERLMRSLKSYRRRTPGTPGAKAELDYLAQQLTFFRLKQRELERQDRREPAAKRKPATTYEEAREQDRWRAFLDASPGAGGGIKSLPAQPTETAPVSRALAVEIKEFSIRRTL